MLLTQIRDQVRLRLRPFTYGRFTIFYSAQAISLVGNWMQELAKSWIVLSLTGKASAIGALMFANALPYLLLMSFGGELADRRPLRNILIWTQLVLAVLAFALGMVVITGSVQYWHLLVFAAMEGVVVAFDLPAFNKITPTLVPREYFQQALALNSVNFHTSRVLGPSIAGVVMGIWGPASVFWINALSFLGIMWVIARVSFHEVSDGFELTNRTPESGKMKEALSAIFHNPNLRRLFLQLLLIIMLVFPLVFTTFRLYVQNRFHLSSKDFGLVFASPGLGALLGSLAFLAWNPKNPVRGYPLGSLGLIVFLIGIAEAQTLTLSTFFLGCFSFCMYLSLTSLTVSLQLRIDNRVRGRVSALIGMCFISIAPMMGAPIGVISDFVGERHLIWLVALSFALANVLFPLRDRYAHLEAQKKRARS